MSKAIQKAIRAARATRGHLTLVDKGTRPLIAAARREAARRDLLSFIEYTMAGFVTNWHHELMCKYIMRWLTDGTGRHDRLIIQAPPRHGKSEIVSRRLPAFVLGRNPNNEVINASYGAELAQRMNRDVQRIIDSRDYYDVFPQTTLKQSMYGKPTDKLRNTRMFEIIEAEGSLVSVGVGGAITGMGGDIIIIDDPVKNMKDALSDAVKKGVFEWYDSTIYTRLETGGKILLTLTRWAQDDLAGMLLEKMKNDPEADQWDVLSLPALYYPPDEFNHINEADPRAPGEALWPWKKDKQALERIRASVHSRVWTSLYQQNPRPEQGEIWETDHFEVWPDHEIEKLTLYNQLTAWDLAYTTNEANSASAFVSGGVNNNRAIIDAADYYYLEFPKLVEKMKGIKPTRRLGIENKASGPSAQQTLYADGVAAELIEVESDKLSRTYDVVTHGIRGKIIVAETVARRLLQDPKQGVIAVSADNPDIDLNDALTMFLRELLGKYGAEDWDALGADPDLSGDRPSAGL